MLAAAAGCPAQASGLILEVVDLLTFILLVLGGVLLVVGAEGLVRGASRLAVTAGISPLVVGLTVVAFATSSPELAVGIASTFAGDPDIAMGNVIGSNIFNILVILGLAAVVSPLIVAQRLVVLEVPLVIAASVVMLAFALDGGVSRVEGLILFSGLVAYLTWAVRQSRRESRDIQAEYEAEFSARDETARAIAVDVVLVLGGLGMLVLGSEVFVSAAVEVAEELGVTELVIGLTIVAAGTSLPEVATSVLASVRGERDIAVGNVVGSNLFNILAVLGLTALLAEGGVAAADSAISLDIPIMIAVALLLLPVVVLDNDVARWEGILFIGYYVAYTTYLLLDATDNPAAGEFGLVMLGFVVPITVVALLALVGRHLWQRRQATTGGSGPAGA